MKIKKATRGIIMYESKNANELLALPVEHLRHKAFDYSAIVLVVPDSILE